MTSTFTTKAICGICKQPKESVSYTVDSSDGTKSTRTIQLCNRCDGNHNIPRLQRRI